MEQRARESTLDRWGLLSEDAHHFEESEESKQRRQDHRTLASLAMIRGRYEARQASKRAAKQQQASRPKKGRRVTRKGKGRKG